MACWNGCEKSICDMIVLSVQRSEFLFFLPNLIFHMLSSSSCKLSPEFTRVDRGPPGLSTKQSLAPTEEENCSSNLAEVKGPKMLRQLQAVDKIITVLLPIGKIYEF